MAQGAASQTGCREFRHPGIILGTVPFRDADSLITVLCRDKGRLSAIARGARRSQKRFMGGLDLFDCGVFHLRQNRENNQLYALQSLDAREYWPELRGSLIAFQVASYCAEITRAFTADGDPQASNLFNPLYFTLSTLNNLSTPNKQSNVRHAYSLAVFFNLTLLQRSGLNYLDDTPQTPCLPETRIWFQEMIDRSSVIVPHEHSTIERGFLTLSRHTQALLGHPLHSIRDLQKPFKANP